MDKRPIFSDKLSVKDFEKYYWYKDELVKICRKNNLPSYGTKAELNQYIVSLTPLNNSGTNQEIQKF